MKPWGRIFCLLAILFGGTLPLAAQSSSSYVVQPGDIPGATEATPEATATPTPTATPAATPATVEPGGIYVVRAGDNLFRIAPRHGITVPALKAANGLSADIVYVSQHLTIPGACSSAPSNPSPAPPVINPGASGGKWIDINLSTQTITAYAGQTPPGLRL